MSRRATAGWARSLQWRVLLGTLAGLALALVLAGVLLSGLFREHANRQFQAELAMHLEQLTARLAFDASGQPQMDPTRLTDPRWQKPLSGRYWQVDRRAPDNPAQAGRPSPPPQAGVLRSRSLWDQVLQLPPDAVLDGTVHTHTVTGPDGHPLRVLERSVRDPEHTGAIWTLIVAADARETQGAIDAFSGLLAASLAVLLLLLAMAGVAQVWVALAPLRALQAEVAALSRGERTRLTGRFPAEVQPLADDFNAALDAQADHLARARTQAGNLAHALKTPLAVLQQTADQLLAGPAALAPPAVPAAPSAPAVPAPPCDAPAGTPPTATHSTPATDREHLQALARQVQDQVTTARRQVDWHLKRARAAATAGTGATASPVWPAVRSLVQVMGRVHAERAIAFDLPADPPELVATADPQDLHEMLGNLLDNACQWTRTTVAVRTQADEATVTVRIEDDGPGLPPPLRTAMLTRGARLDESAPGSGLGLSIVDNLARLYGGHLQLHERPGGGLQAVLTLPRVRPQAANSPAPPPFTAPAP